VCAGDASAEMHDSGGSHFDMQDVFWGCHTCLPLMCVSQILSQDRCIFVLLDLPIILRVLEVLKPRFRFTKPGSARDSTIIHQSCSCKSTSVLCVWVNLQAPSALFSTAGRFRN
jgi:hypothetical protein